MRKKYNLPKHVKSYITNELYNYENNKKKLIELQEDILFSSPSFDGQPRGNLSSDTTYKKAEKLISSRSILIVTDKIKKIENALNKLTVDEREIAELIFIKGHSQLYAQTYDYISKETYYHIKNKTIYLAAIEYGEV